MRRRHTIEEIEGMRILLHEMGYFVKKPSKIFCDCKGVLLAANNNGTLLKKLSTALSYHKIVPPSAIFFEKCINISDNSLT